MNLTVMILAWIVLALGAANAYVLFRTRGEVTAGLPFAGYVEYTPVVVKFLTWGGHVGAPAWLSTIGTVGLAVAACATAGLRRIGERAGPLLFISTLVALLGLTGSVIGLALIALATVVGVAVVLVLAALVAAACLLLLAALLSG